MEKPYTFAQRLQTIMDDRHLSRSDLAELSGINKSNITRYLRGDYEAKQDVVYTMASRLGVNAAWLMGYDVPMKEKEKPAEIDGQISEQDLKLLSWFRSLPPEKQRAILFSQDAPEGLA